MATSSSKQEKLPTLEYETQFGYPHIWIAGADEVGRGCLAGPVVAAAVVLPREISYEKDSWLKEIKDSKLLLPAVREKLVPLISKWAAAFAIGVASVTEIDQINIFHASHLAMVRAIHNLNKAFTPQHILVDGKFLPKQLGIPATAIVKGDLKCLSIAAASVLAKVWRDQYMAEIDQKYPGYGFAQNKGYPTSAHTQALKKIGISDIHRRSFNLAKMV